MNIPNALSIFRIALIPCFAYLHLQGGIYAATVVFLAACFTDILDGYIARTYNMITNLGKVLDPIADKGMFGTVVVCMGISNDLPMWIIIIILIKELLLLAGGAMLVRKRRVVSALWFGKLATVVTGAGIVAILLFPDMPPGLKTIICVCMVIVSLFSLIYYLRNFIRVVAK